VQPVRAVIRALVLRQMDEGRSTVDAITALYPKLSVGGYCLIDDY
jgi:hypothetical protein